MPVGDDFQLAPNHTREQFEYYLDKSVTRPSEALAKDGYELLFSRSGDEGSLDFLPRNDVSFWARRRNRKQTREELTRLINESFGKNFASVRRWGLFEESIGSRLLRDCAPQGLFSVTKIDEEALNEIARRVHALRQTIADDEQAANPEERSLRVRTYKDKLKTYVLSPKALKVLYERARSLAPRENGALLTDDRGDESPLMNGDILSATAERDHGTDQDIAVTVNRPQADQGTAEFALSEAYRRGLQGKERDRNQGAYYLALAAQKGNTDAREELYELAEDGDRRLQQAVYKVYREGRGEVAQNMPEAAVWLARSWQGLLAARAHTSWVKAPGAEDGAAPVPPGAMELELSKLLLTGNDWIEKNPEKAAYFLLLAAQRGDRQAQAKLAELAAARGAEGDDLALQLGLYHVYRKGGEDIDQDMAEAVLWLARATAGPDGQNGDDQRTALSWLKARICAEDGDAHMRHFDLGPTLFELSNLYRTGRKEIAPDLDKAAYFLALAAEPRGTEAGHEEAIAALKEMEEDKAKQPALQFALYELYRKGADGVERDLNKAEPWLVRAMGVQPIFEEDYAAWEEEFFQPPVSPRAPGADLPPAFMEAAAKFEQGDREFTLYEAYRDGTGGVNQDMNTALYWLLKAQDGTYHKRAKDAYEALSWRDYKQYGGERFNRDLYDVKLRGEIYSSNDPETYYELATSNKKINDTKPYEHDLTRYTVPLWTAAQHDLPKAQYELAQLYKGRENRIDSDDLDYAHWLIRAAQNNHPKARAELAALKAQRRDGAADPIAARLQNAVGQLYTQGRYDLGRSVIEPNLEEAKAFTKAAVENGYGANAATALNTLEMNGLPPRKPIAMDLTAPVPQPIEEFEAWPLNRLFLANRVEEIKLLDKMLRGIAEFSCSNEAAAQWLRQRGIEIDPSGLIEAHSNAVTALIELIHHVAKTGKIDERLQQRVEQCNMRCKQEVRQFTNFSHPWGGWLLELPLVGTNPLTQALKDDAAAREKIRNHQPFPREHLMPDGVRSTLEEDAERLRQKIHKVTEIFLSKTPLVFGNALDPYIDKVFDNIVGSVTNPNLRSLNKRSVYGYDAWKLGLWHIANDLGLVDGLKPKRELDGYMPEPIM